MNGSLTDKKIALLFRENASYAGQNRPLVDHLCALWKEMGAEIVIIRGSSEVIPGVDLLIPHIDLTVMPGEYVDYMNQYPRVANRKLSDISKSVISANLVTRHSRHPGPVVVKTNQNYGGYPEMKRGPARALTAVRPGRLLRPWHRVKAVRPEHYRVFDKVCEVPNGVWENERLVVEKFIPEREGELYCHHISLVMGDEIATRRLFSHAPIIKGKNIIRSDIVEAPGELRAVKERFGLDYGKLDYVVHDGHIEVLDVNKTPGSPPLAGNNLKYLCHLANGVRALL